MRARTYGNLYDKTVGSLANGEEDKGFFDMAARGSVSRAYRMVAVGRLQLLRRAAVAGGAAAAAAVVTSRKAPARETADATPRLATVFRARWWGEPNFFPHPVGSNSSTLHTLQPLLSDERSTFSFFVHFALVRVCTLWPAAVARLLVTHLFRG